MVNLLNMFANVLGTSDGLTKKGEAEPLAEGVRPNEALTQQSFLPIYLQMIALASLGNAQQKNASVLEIIGNQSDSSQTTVDGSDSQIFALQGKSDFGEQSLSSAADASMFFMYPPVIPYSAGNTSVDTLAENTETLLPTVAGELSSVVTDRPNMLSLSAKNAVQNGTATSNDTDVMLLLPAGQEATDAVADPAVLLTETENVSGVSSNLELKGTERATGQQGSAQTEKDTLSAKNAVQNGNSTSNDTDETLLLPTGQEAMAAVDDSDVLFTKTGNASGGNSNVELKPNEQAVDLNVTKQSPVKAPPTVKDAPVLSNTENIVKSEKSAEIAKEIDRVMTQPANREEAARVSSVPPHSAERYAKQENKLSAVQENKISLSVQAEKIEPPLKQTTAPVKEPEERKNIENKSERSSSGQSEIVSLDSSEFVKTSEPNRQDPKSVKPFQPVEASSSDRSMQSVQGADRGKETKPAFGSVASSTTVEASTAAIKGESSNAAGSGTAGEHNQQFANTFTLNRTLNVVEASVPSSEPKIDLAQTKSIIEQIAKEVILKVDDQSSEIRLVLKPETLGEVSVKVRMEAGRVMAHIEVSNAAVKSALDANLPQLQQALTAQGFEVDQVKVFIAGQSLFRESSGQNESRSRQSRKHRLHRDVLEEYQTVRLMGYNTMEIII